MLLNQWGTPAARGIKSPLPITWDVRPRFPCRSRCRRSRRSTNLPPVTMVAARPSRKNSSASLSWIAAPWHRDTVLDVHVERPTERRACRRSRCALLGRGSLNGFAHLGGRHASPWSDRAGGPPERPAAAPRGSTERRKMTERSILEPPGRILCHRRGGPVERSVGCSRACSQLVAQSRWPVYHDAFRGSGRAFLDSIRLCRCATAYGKLKTRRLTEFRPLLDAIRVVQRRIQANSLLHHWNELWRGASPACSSPRPSSRCTPSW